MYVVHLLENVFHIHKLDIKYRACSFIHSFIHSYFLSFFFSSSNLLLPTLCRSRGLFLHQITRNDSNTHTTVGRTLPDEGSDRHRDLYLTTHNTDKRQVIHAPWGIRTRIPSQETIAQLRLRPHGHQDRRKQYARFQTPLPCTINCFDEHLTLFKPLQCTSHSVRCLKRASLRKCFIARKAVVTTSYNSCDPTT